MISVDSEKSFGTIQDTFPIKTLSKTGIKGNFLNQMKSNYEKHIGSIIFNGEELNGFPLRSRRIRQKCSFSSLLFNIVLEVLASAIRQKKKEGRREGERRKEKKRESIPEETL